MKFFLDTANIEQIEEAASWGVISGVTTNPSLYAREGGKLDQFHDHIKRICEIVDGPVSAETVTLTRDEIVAEGEVLAAIHPNVVVKVPTMPEGLAATHTLGIVVDLPTALLLSVVAALSACGASGVAGGSLLLIPLSCGLFGIPNDIAMQVVAVGFVISVLQDSAETALNSSTDVVFTAAVCGRPGSSQV